ELQSEEQQRVYETCAQLLVHDLLRLKNGRRCMVELLKGLHERFNWQTAFLEAFGAHFPRLIDWDKWWSARVGEVSQKEPFGLFTTSEQLRQLDQALKMPV